jgi:hypothetical protein
MKKAHPLDRTTSVTKKGYNENNPGQTHGAFPPSSMARPPKTNKIKSNTADKKTKEAQP